MNGETVNIDALMAKSRVRFGTKRRPRPLLWLITGLPKAFPLPWSQAATFPTTETASSTPRRKGRFSKRMKRL